MKKEELNEEELDMDRQEPEESVPLLLRFWREWRGFIIFWACLFVLLKFVLLICVVPSGSMLPTLNIGEMVVAEQISPKLGNVERGDIVVFPHDDVLFIKRVVGLPGETVTVSEGSVYIDGEKLDESAYLSEQVWTDAPFELGDPAVYEVPEGCIMVMGDNRENSYDARYWPEEERYVAIDDITAVTRFHCYNFISRLMLKVNNVLHPNAVP